MVDIGFTHIALPVTNIEDCVSFYTKYAKLELKDQRIDEQTGIKVAWLGDGLRPFVLVLAEVEQVQAPLLPFAHLGIALESKEEVDRLCNMAKEENILVKEAEDYGPPVGYWAFIKDPDGHTVELSWGQEVGLKAL
jgi:catechol 2,3-dioxygenase-like lactoylglutathione lyase family enzyme